MIKILFPIGAFFPSQFGGPSNTIYWHTQELSNNNNIETTVVTTTVGIDKGKVIENEMFNNGFGKVYYGTGQNITFPTVKMALSNVRYNDIIHFNSLFHPLSIITFFYTRLFYRNKKLVWSVRGELSSEAMKFSSWKKKPILFLYKKLNHRVLYHSTSQQETLDIKSVFKKSEVFEIPNLIQPAQRISMLQIKKQLLFVGRIHPIKAIHKIILGLSLSKAFMESDFIFVIVGTHEQRHVSYYNSLLTLIEDKGLKEKVVFAGHVTGKEKEIMYAESYLSLLLSESENYGNVVLESLNQGTPVICSLGTPWSILESYECGYHISNEPEEIAATIDRVIRIPENEYSMYRQKSINLVESKFEIKSQIHHWVSIYNKICGK